MATKQWHTGGADFGGGGTYRYRLWRVWDETRPRLLWVLLNPSTADGQTDDRTVRRCLYFTRREETGDGEKKYGSLEVVNLFAYCATSRKDLKRTKSPIGPKNERYLTDAMACATDIVIAWGEDGVHLQRDLEVLELLRLHVLQHPLCLDTVSNGCPRHPVRRANSAAFMRYDSAETTYPVRQKAAYQGLLNAQGTTD